MIHKTVLLVALIAGCATQPATNPTTQPTTTHTQPAATTNAYGPYLDFMAEEAAFATDISQQLFDLADDLDRGDLAAATTASIELWKTFAYGDRAPNGYPLAAQHDTMMDNCETAFDIISDIFIANNYEQLDADLMTDCTTAITNLTAAVTNITP